MTELLARRTHNLAVSLWSLAGFVLGRLEFKSSAMNLYTIEALNLNNSFSFSQVFVFQALRKWEWRVKIVLWAQILCP